MLSEFFLKIIQCKWDYIKQDKMRCLYHGKFWSYAGIQYTSLSIFPDVWNWPWLKNLSSPIAKLRAWHQSTRMRTVSGLCGSRFCLWGVSLSYSYAWCPLPCYFTLSTFGRTSSPSVAQIKCPSLAVLSAAAPWQLILLCIWKFKPIVFTFNRLYTAYWTLAWFWVPDCPPVGCS